MGHRDGGALAMKTYGHHRDQHSAAMAAKVFFKPESHDAKATGEIPLADAPQPNPQREN